MPSQQQIQAWLDEAYAARHALSIGKARVSVRMADRSVEYSRATIADLNAYIAELESQLNGAVAPPVFFRATQTGKGY